MANNYKFPGVYSNINDLSTVVSINATTACAYVGEAEFGPVFKPTLLTSLSDYMSRFGTLSSKYGYAGYSLAVASETIPEHYFVRVVPTGDGENDARWASAGVLEAHSSLKESELAKNGYTYSEITEREEKRDAGMDPNIFSDSDEDNAMVIVASNPNNRNFLIGIEDTTVNTNKTYVIEYDCDPQINDESGDSYTTVTAKVPAAFIEDYELAIGDPILTSRMGNDALNGTFTIEKLDEKNNKIVFTARGYIEKPEDKLVKKARMCRYPESSDTSFSVTVYEKNGKTISALENFDVCTLFPAIDSYGNSTFVEDVINSKSNYIQVFANPRFAENTEYFAPRFYTSSGNVLTEADLLPLKNGKSGTWGNDTDRKYKDLVQGWEQFRDRTQVSVSLLMNCGYVTENHLEYQAKMLEIAEDRRDCFCIFDTPMTETAFEDLRDWRFDEQVFTSYRAANCAPWVRAYDSIQGRSNFIMCPSAYMAKIMGTNDPWKAPAGLNRGVLSSGTISPTGLTQNYNSIQGGILYADKQINCIVKDAAAGYVMWGQKTLQSKASAMDRINVARTVIYIETILRDAVRYHLFENNTTYERTQITLQLNSFLNTILSADGIQKFQVKCDSENNTAAVIAQNQLVIDVYLWPSYCAEVITLNLNVEGSDVSVSVSSSSNY